MTLALEPVDTLAVTTLVDNSVDILAADAGPAKRAPLGALPAVEASLIVEGHGPDAPVAEHGFSALLSMERAGRMHHVLFDTGISERGMVENMRRLSIDPKDVETVVLSHGHFDHTMGLHGLAEAVGRRNLPLILHPDAWLRRRIAVPGRDPLEIPTLSAPALRANGFEVIEERQPSFLLDGALLVTGEVDRTTTFEQGFPPHQALHDGAWAPDPLVRDDQAIVAHVRDKGLVVITGCGHAGVVNIVRHAMALTGVARVYAVIGGFHLTGGLFEPIIPQTVDALADLAPTLLVPAHCTGALAVRALGVRMPEAVVANSIGTRFEL